jgi:chromosome segregation ATPase
VEKRTASEDKLKQEASKLSSELEAAKAVVKAGENEIRDLREVCQSLRGELSDLRKSSGVLQEQYTGTREELGTTLGRMQALEDAVAEKHALAKDRELLKLDLQSASFRFGITLYLPFFFILRIIQELHLPTFMNIEISWS